MSEFKFEAWGGAHSISQGRCFSCVLSDIDECRVCKEWVIQNVKDIRDAKLNESLSVLAEKTKASEIKRMREIIFGYPSRQFQLESYDIFNWMNIELFIAQMSESRLEAFLSRIDRSDFIKRYGLANAYIFFQSFPTILIYWYQRQCGIQHILPYQKDYFQKHYESQFLEHYHEYYDFCDILTLDKAMKRVRSWTIFADEYMRRVIMIILGIHKFGTHEEGCDGYNCACFYPERIRKSSGLSPNYSFKHLPMDIIKHIISYVCTHGWRGPDGKYCPFQKYHIDPNYSSSDSEEEYDRYDRYY